MDYERYIKKLRLAHEEINEAIRTLEALAARQGLNGAPARRGPGRPRKDAAIQQAMKPGKNAEKSDSGAA